MKWGKSCIYPVSCEIWTRNKITLYKKLILCVLGSNILQQPQIIVFPTFAYSSKKKIAPSRDFFTCDFTGDLIFGTMLCRSKLRAKNIKLHFYINRQSHKSKQIKIVRQTWTNECIMFIVFIPYVKYTLRLRWDTHFYLALS